MFFKEAKEKSLENVKKALLIFTITLPIHVNTNHDLNKVLYPYIFINDDN